MDKKYLKLERGSIQIKDPKYNNKSDKGCETEYGCCYEYGCCPFE